MFSLINTNRRGIEAYLIIPGRDIYLVEGNAYREAGHQSPILNFSSHSLPRVSRMKAGDEFGHHAPCGFLYSEH